MAALQRRCSCAASGGSARNSPRCSRARSDNPRRRSLLRPRSVCARRSRSTRRSVRNQGNGPGSPRLRRVAGALQQSGGSSIASRGGMERRSRSTSVHWPLPRTTTSGPHHPTWPLRSPNPANLPSASRARYARARRSRCIGAHWLHPGKGARSGRSCCCKLLAHTIWRSLYCAQGRYGLAQPLPHARTGDAREKPPLGPDHP